MPKRSTLKCTLHKPTGQARVRNDGRDHYLGKYGTPVSEREYRRRIGRWLESHDLPDVRSLGHHRRAPPIRQSLRIGPAQRTLPRSY